MKLPVKIAIGLAIAAVVAGLIGLWWYVNMELRWEPVHRPPEEMQKNRMHVATLLLRQHAHQVSVAGTLGETSLDTLPDGTLLMADGFGSLSPDKAEQLLAWVRRGNTLIAQPRYLSGAESELLDSQDGDEDEDEAGDAGAAAAASAASATSAASASASAEAASASADDEDDEDGGSGVSDGPLAALVETDPIAVRYGVRLSYLAPSKACLAKRKLRAPRVKGQVSTSCPAPIAECEAQAITHLTVPGTGAQLELQSDHMALVSLPGAPAPLWHDAENTALRSYAEGKGRVVMMATNYFDNASLQQKDHAEALLALAALNRGAGHVTIVKHLEMLPWYRLLWDRYHMAMLALSALLALVMWAAVRRFGPLLPDPATERRSLMEHIDASGAWLWKAGGGAQVLLEAARAEALALVRRRAPGLMRLPADELPGALARECGMSEALVRQALYDPAHTHPQQFTRQIRTLQTLRNHHER